MKDLELNGKAYSVIRLLGKGKGGYSYLVSLGENLYVLKQIHHEPCEYYSFGNKLEAEICDYKRLKEIGVLMPRLLEIDYKKERILKEFIEGDSVFDLVLHDKMQPIYLDKIKQICILLYKSNTNIDYFPTNFVVRNEELYYIDYECNDYSEEWNFENWGVKYWSKTKEFKEYLIKQK